MMKAMAIRSEFLVLSMLLNRVHSLPSSGGAKSLFQQDYGDTCTQQKSISNRMLRKTSVTNNAPRQIGRGCHSHADFDESFLNKGTVRRCHPVFDIERLSSGYEKDQRGFLLSFKVSLVQGCISHHQFRSSSSMEHVDIESGQEVARNVETRSQSKPSCDISATSYLETCLQTSETKLAACS